VLELGTDDLKDLLTTGCVFDPDWNSAVGSTEIHALNGDALHLGVPKVGTGLSKAGGGT